MNINIDKLISELKDEKSKANKELRKYRTDIISTEKSFLLGTWHAFDLLMDKLIALKKDESKQPQPPDFANTALGEVPQVVNDQPGENLKAVEGATPVVRRNEQTRELLLFLKFMKENKHRYMLTDEKRFVDEFQKQRLAASALDK